MNFKFGSIFFLILISLIPIVPLINPGLPITHDGQDHVARIANFYKSLSEGIIIPRWAGNLNWGFGHPILMFLYPLPSYTASLFHFLGFSLVDSVKIVFGLAFVSSGIAMYLWVKNFLGNTAGVVSAILYLFAPYRFVDLYVRGAIGEHVAFVFPPLILYFLLKLSKKYSYWYVLGGSLSLAGLVLSHNAISIMFLPFIGLYLLYLIYNSQNRNLFILNSVFLILLGFGMSSFFLIPAYFEGKYTLRDIVTGGEALQRFVNLKDLIYGPWNYGGTGRFSVQIGIVNWILVIGSLFVIRRFPGKEKKLPFLYLITFIYFIFSIFLMLKESEFIWKTFTTLQKFQFPWRFLSVSVFSTALLGGFFFYSIKNSRIQKILLLITIISVVILTKDYFRAKDYLNKPEAFYTGIYESTTDTGESSPRWSVRFMEKKPKDTIEVVEGQAKIRKLERTSTLHRYEVESLYSSRIKENTLYFPGWKVYVDGKEYQGLQFQDPNHRGLITFKLVNGKHLVDVVLEETKLRKLSDFISLVTLIFIGTLSIYVLKFKKTKFN
ncbi:MAG: 6-pyruvoyl-tetrahydropterin synthase-related protein [bacterium]|nr:6-pyruvoyl-tetrahydropterin synthase-related protein [bacterium]